MKLLNIKLFRNKNYHKNANLFFNSLVFQVNFINLLLSFSYCARIQEFNEDNYGLRIYPSLKFKNSSLISLLFF